ncbi:phosphatase PAP2 family protein [Dyadobacter psychrotolerans]|uniref:Phosphatase PAP2 family protein n=1 Tax=Dyadobacter psychrotolerans TaxID=2541721 RepID=A0A4R5DGI5_9BACT|nr:phosphatase PAP2 family protein [Dyadobacter psychrotolerans]TDE11021.1 phosphatase PAP2 family protein [Dyadobacter psychrotolerans]
MRTLVILLVFSSWVNASPVMLGDTLPARKPVTLRTFYPPASLIIGGLLSTGHSEEAIRNEVAEERNHLIPHFRTKVDDYLQFSPLVIAYGLDAFGVHSKTDLINRTVILIKGEAMALTTVTLLKSATHTLRPDGSSYNSFPSGHTTQAFAAATFLNEEYKDRYPWMPYASYTVASSVGLLRVANNRHYISDVLVGAGIGYLSMKVAYWTHLYKWGKARRKHQLVY